MPLEVKNRDRVVLENLSLVRLIALRVYANLPLHVDLDDLVHSGILGLLDAASKFDPKKQVVFSSYAKHRIKGAIIDGLRTVDWATRELRKRHNQLQAVTHELSSELYRMPTEAEIAKRLGIDLDLWRKMRIDLVVGLVSANRSHEMPPPDFSSKPDTRPDSMCAQAQLRTLLTEAMNTLTERYRKVVVLRYTNEMTMREIGVVLGIQESRVSQIHKSALAKMNIVLQDVGIHGCNAFNCETLTLAQQIKAQD